MALFRGEMAAIVAAAAQAPATAGEAARRLLQDPSYQRDLPREKPPVDLPPFDAPWLGRLLELLLYTVAAVALALLVTWIVSRLLARRARDVAVAAEGDDAPALDVRLDQPDRLAAAGRFADAIHQLLLETLAAISRAWQLPPSYTSREVLARARLPGRAREALSGLVLAVELSRFGGAPATEADYQACLAQFQAFLASYRGPAEPASEAAA
jgi:hypothetical protein